MRATERMTDVTLKTIGKLVLDVGEGCERLHNRMFVDLHCSTLQLDEQWSFVKCKTKNVRPEHDEAVVGEQWTFKALDVASRAIISYVVGKRTGDNANSFLLDIRRRVLGEPMLASDGFKPYVDAVEDAFGIDCRFGQLVKQYEGDHKTSGRNGHYKGAVPVPIVGKMTDKEINTSYAERENLTTRLNMKRLARQSLCFSKSLKHHKAAIALNIAYYNLVRVHKTLRCTPAMQLGITDHVWSIDELVRVALAEPCEPEAPPAPLWAAALTPQPPRLTMLRGGRID